VGAFYDVASRLFEVGFAALGLDLRVTGLEHIPTSGPAILAANHVGYLDFAFVMLAPPRPRRTVRYLARGDLFDRPLTGRALRALGQVPVEEHRDLSGTLAAARRLLEAGELVGLHPEATVNPTFLPIRGKSGAVRLAQATGAPIVPVGLWGTQRLLTKWRDPVWPGRGLPIDVRYGAPLHPEPGPAAPWTRTLMARITALVETSIRTEGAPAGAWWVPAAHGGAAPTLAEVEARLAAQVTERRQRVHRIS